MLTLFIMLLVVSRGFRRFAFGVLAVVFLGNTFGHHGD